MSRINESASPSTPDGIIATAKTPVPLNPRRNPFGRKRYGADLQAKSKKSSRGAGSTRDTLSPSIDSSALHCGQQLHGVQQRRRSPGSRPLLYSGRNEHERKSAQLGSGPINFSDSLSVANQIQRLGRRTCHDRSVWASREQLNRIKPYFPLSHGVPRADDLKVLSGIVFVIKNGLRWRDAPKEYGPHKTLYNRFIRWSRMGSTASSRRIRRQTFIKRSKRPSAVSKPASCVTPGHGSRR
jgi:hypothetical protein